MTKAFSKILIIGILAVLVGGGIFAWQKWGNLKAETAGWQTYTNEQYGFEFNYPPKFERVSSVDSEAILSFKDQSNTLPRLSTLPDIYLKVLDIPAGKDFKEVLLKDVVFDGSGLNPKSFAEFSQKKIGDNNVYFIRSGLFEGILSTNYYLIQGNKIFAFYLHSSPVDWTRPGYKPEDDKLNLDFRQILAGFKFLK